MNGYNRFAPVKEGDELDVKIEALGDKGDGIAKKDGFVLVIPGTQVNDEVRVRVTKVLRRVGFAEVVGKSEGGAAEEPKEEPAEEPGEEEALEEVKEEEPEEIPEEPVEETKEEEPVEKMPEEEPEEPAEEKPGKKGKKEAEYSEDFGEDLEEK